MSLKISASSLFEKRFLLVDSAGVKMCDGMGFTGARRVSFRQIDCVLMSPDHKLSLQMGTEIFSVPTKPGNAKHQAVIAALLQELQRSATAAL